MPSIVPVVAQLHDYHPDKLLLNAAEVAEAFTVPIQSLCDPRHFGHTQFRLGDGSGYSVPVFNVGGAHRIWGLTAVITHMFLMSLVTPQSYGRRKIPMVSKYVARE